LQAPARQPQAQPQSQSQSQAQPQPQPEPDEEVKPLEIVPRPNTGVVLRRMIERRPYRRYLLREVFD
jgi:hypothetical protein